MTGWNIQRLKTYGSYWKWWIFWPVMLVFKGASLIIKIGNFPTWHFWFYWRVVYLHDQSVEMRDRKLGQRFMWAVTSWAPLVFVVYPVGGFKYFFMFTPILGEMMIQFDEPILSNGLKPPTRYRWLCYPVISGLFRDLLNVPHVFFQSKWR